jgi:hypothetical protein
MMKDWDSRKSMWGADQFDEDWDEAFDRALRRVKKWEDQLATEAEQKRQREAIL